MKVELQNLDPGAVVETPAVLRALGWNRPTSIYLFGANGGGSWPVFLAGSNTAAFVQQVAWPAGPQGQPAPIPEFFEVVEDKPLLEQRKGRFAKGEWLGLPYNGSSGTDPEFFVVDSKGEVIPARSFLPAKKAARGYYFDGLQAEIAPAAQGCLEVLSSGIYAQLAAVEQCARAKFPGARITLRNTFKFSPEQMKSFSDEDVAFRCSSSLNVYDDLGQQPDAREYPWRFAGGHIHIGTHGLSAPVIRAMVRALDGILGVAGVSLARNWDSAERRRMYGRAGEFRLPKWGLEYRVLSNYWLCSPLIYHPTFELMRYAYRIGQGGAFDLLYEGKEEEIRECINNCDVQLACKLIERNLGLYKHIFGTIWKAYPRAVARAMETLQNGLEVVVPEPDQIIENWKHGHGTSHPVTWRRSFS